MCTSSKQRQFYSILTNCLEKTISLTKKKKNPTDTIYYTAWLLALTRGSEGMRKGQALKKQPRYIENWG